MKLEEYIQRKGLKKKFFAEEMGVHPETLTKWMQGKSVPHPTVIKMISIYTDGAVTSDDFKRCKK